MLTHFDLGIYSMEISRNMHKQLCKKMLTATLVMCENGKTKLSIPVNGVISNDSSIGCNV